MKYNFDIRYGELSKGRINGILINYIAMAMAFITSFLLIAGIIGAFTSNAIVQLIIFFGILFGIPTIIFWYFAIRKLFFSEEDKKKYVISKLVRQESRTIEGDKELFLYEYDELYREKVINEIKKREDFIYKAQLTAADNKRRQIENKRNLEITRQANLRWKVEGKIKVNMDEGKVFVNGNEYYFSDIHGARVNATYSQQYVTQTHTNNSSKSKKSVSLCGAVVGGLVAGPVGAVVGGVGLAKNKTKGSQQTYTATNCVSTCDHVGVMVDMNGFVSEILVLNRAVEQSSPVYVSAMREAENIVGTLRRIATLPVPDNVIAIEEKPTVLALTKELEAAENEYIMIKENTPRYELPDKFKDISIL